MKTEVFFGFCTDGRRYAYRQWSSNGTVLVESLRVESDRLAAAMLRHAIGPCDTELVGEFRSHVVDQLPDQWVLRPVDVVEWVMGVSYSVSACSTSKEGVRA